jgi:hypothetical protein
MISGLAAGVALLARGAKWAGCSTEIELRRIES